MPGYGLFATADGGQVALGVINEQHFWSSLCEELALGALADLGFDERVPAGRRAPARRSPRPSPPSPATSWWPASSPPACPSRRCSTARACWPHDPFPRFPIRLPLSRGRPARPALDQHRGEGFAEPG